MVGGRSGLDAILIADCGDESLSGTSPFKLKLGEREADIQVVRNFIANNGRITEPIVGDKRYSWASAPKLNGIFLYSYLTENRLNVSLIHNFTKEKETFKQQLSENPKAVVISTPFIFFKNALRELVDDIRELAPDIYIIAGGAFVHASSLVVRRSTDPDYETEAASGDYLFLKVDQEPDIDLYIISSRGESLLVQALNSIINGRSPAGIPNTARLVNGSYVFAETTDDIGTTNVHAINWTTLPDSFFNRGVIPLQASNGCPYQCAFCNFTKDKRLMYVKPVDKLVSELQDVARRGTRYVWFVDDNFRLGRSDLNEVCQRFISEDIQVQWMCFIRASTLAATNLDLLHRAGCIEVQIGLESGDPQILNNMNKKADPQMYSKVIGDVLAHGINVSCYFISGFPGETAATAATTRDFIRNIEHPDMAGSLSWSIYPFILSPLSPVYEPEMRTKYELTGYMHKWSHRTMDYQEARKEVLTAFLELEHSGPIYRGDNLDMIQDMEQRDRKDFYRTRHALAKKGMQGDVLTDEILRSFRGIL